jgi:hypothetical protein
MVIKSWNFYLVIYSPYHFKTNNIQGFGNQMWPNLTFVNIYKSTSPFPYLIITLQMKLKHSTFTNEITNFPNEIQMLKITFNLSKKPFKFCKWNLTYFIWYSTIPNEF